MSTISKTANLGLTQYNGIDDPIIYQDYTADMLAIDAYCKALSDDIDTLEIDVNSLKDRADALEAFVKIDALNTTAQTVSEAINELVASDSTLSDRIDALADRVTVNEGDISDLKTWKNNTVDPTLEAYDGRLDAIEAVIATVSTQNIDDMIARIDALEEKVNTNAQNIDTLTENYDRLEDRVTANEQALGTISGNIATLSNRVTLLETCCTEVRATLVELRTDVNKNASDIADILIRLTRDESNIAGNAQDIILLAQQQSTQATSINDLYDRIEAFDPSAPSSLYARVGALETVVGDASAGLVKDVDDLTTGLASAEGDIDVLEGVVGDADSGLVKSVDDLTSTVGDNSSGLVADVNALESTVGDGTAGLVKDVTDLGTAVGSLETTVGDNSSGLVKDVGDLQTTVGDNSAGLVKDVSDNTSAIGDLSTLTTTDKTDLVAAVNEVNGKTDVYSTTEVKTDRVWTDNKPIYRTCFEYTIPNTAGTTYANFSWANMANADVIVDIKGTIEINATSKATRSISYYLAGTDYSCISLERNQNQVTHYIADRTFLQGAKCKLIIEYTKV